MRLVFLGTGASGGTPGTGRSRRLESSLLVDAGRTVLIDVTRHFDEQSRRLDRIDAVLLTHAHRDASGGMARLRRWSVEHGRAAPLPVNASEETIAALRRRFRRLDHCAFRATRPGADRRIGDLVVRALEVPHAREPHVPTFAWRLQAGGAALVYASDVAELTPALKRFARGVSALVIDGAMWGRRLFSHLTIDEVLPELCGWRTGRILLTQIGKTAPPHRELGRAVARICPRAEPSYDGLSLEL